MNPETNPDEMHDEQNSCSQQPLFDDNDQIRPSLHGEEPEIDPQSNRPKDGTPDTLDNIDQAENSDYTADYSPLSESEEIQVISSDGDTTGEVTASPNTDEPVGDPIIDENPDDTLTPVNQADADLSISGQGMNEIGQDRPINYPQAEPSSTIETTPVATLPDPGPGISDINDSLYYIISKRNLPYLLSQGYIGSASERTHYTDDVPDSPKGYISLFASTLGLDLLSHVTEEKDTTPCAIEIPIADLVPFENIVAIGQDQTAIDWTKSPIGTVAALIPGAVPIKSHYRILARSAADVSELTRGSSAGLRHVPYDRFKFTPDDQNLIFSNQVSNKHSMVRGLQADKGQDQIDDLLWLDNVLDRISGGLSAALWLTRLESNVPPEIGLFSNWSESVFRSRLQNQQSLKVLIGEMFEAIPGVDESHKEANDWAFEHICMQLLQTPIDVTPNEREIVDGIKEKIYNSSDLPEAQRSLLIDSIESLEDYLDITSGNSELAPRDRFTSFRALLIALRSINMQPDPQGLEFWLSKKQQHHSVFMVAAFWIGMLTGRRKTELKFRTPEFDDTIAEWTSNQLTLMAHGTSGSAWIDNNPVRLKSVPPIPGADGIRLEVGERILFERKATLFSVFSHSDPESSITQNAAQVLCKEIGDKWATDCILTKIKFRNAIFQGLGRVNQQIWQLELSGAPEVTQEADIGRLVEKLQESENEVPEDFKTQILDLLSPA